MKLIYWSDRSSNRREGDGVKRLKVGNRYCSLEAKNGYYSDKIYYFYVLVYNIMQNTKKNTVKYKKKFILSIYFPDRSTGSKPDVSEVKAS